jgi:superfamily II DNA/RNA helicase
MVCSDVAARGIDIKGLSHVFNFDVPTHAEDYVHRIGRTGRAGLSGRAFMLATRDDAKFLSAIEKLIGNPIPEIALDGFAMSVADEEGGEDHSARRSSRKGRERSGDEKPRRGRSSRPDDSPSPHPPRESGRRRYRDDDDHDEPDNVVGFGDRIPAFLQAAPRPRRT